MARLDLEHRHIVLRIVYDGPAYAGKTTNLSVLAQKLGSEIFSGEEADGRTLYFDWVDYVGGSFNGMPIRCQLVSVPGQRVLQSRRRALLDTADVVVFVADSQPEQLADNIQSFEVLRQILSPKQPPVGIVVQANKRDTAEAIDLATLRSALGDDATLAMTEAIADIGEGVRDAFVLAVRLGIDRVRTLQELEELTIDQPDIDDGPQLLSALLAAEGVAEVDEAAADNAARGALPTAPEGDGPSGSDPAPDAAPQTAPQGPPITADTHTDTGPDTAPPSASPSSSIRTTTGPPFPDASVPPGYVWPPMAGRVAVHEAMRERTHLERDRDGNWVSTSRHWKLSAPLQGLFFDFTSARQGIIDWVAWHTKAGAHLSTPRGVVLMPEADGVWRLWQIVRRTTTLQDTVHELFAQADDHLLGRELYRIIALRFRAQSHFVTSGWLAEVDLTSLAASDNGEPRYTGFAPFPVGAPPGAAASPAAADMERDILRHELGPLMHRELELTPRRLPAMLMSLREAAAADRRHDIADTVQDILLGS